jgi:starch synthase
MKKRIHVVFVTTEIVPFSKVGGLADVMGALPDALEQLGCVVSIVTPLYASIDRKAFGIQPEPDLGPLSAPVGGKRRRFKVHSARKPGTGVKVYFIENRHFYGRSGIYTNPDTGEGFKDEDERTVFLNRAVVETIQAAGEAPDVIHCNDFHAGLIPAYLRPEVSPRQGFDGTAIVYSIHNLAYQGIFERAFMTTAGFDARLFAPMSPFEYFGQVNAMKIGICYSDIVSTVSPTYAKEISTTEEYGLGLEGILRDRGDALVGILNGIDQDVWNPETDELIPHRFSVADLSGKALNKLALLEAYGLPAEPDAALVGIVSRLVDQKGFDILSEAFQSIAKANVRFVILGTGQQKYHERYTELAAIHPDKLGIKLEFNNRLAHLIEAGSDFFLMPSKYEPCGLNQMYSLRYGTIPIVRETGGLQDTVRQLSASGGRGNGIVFRKYAAGPLTKAIGKAVRFYGNAAAMDDVRRRIMAEDHSWLRSAGEYRKLYERAIDRAALRLTIR